MVVLAPPARHRRRGSPRGRRGSLLAGLLLALSLLPGACAAPQPGPIIDYPARQRLMIGLVVDRPHRLQAELESEHAERDAVNQLAWQQAKERQDAYHRHLASLRHSNEALFKRLLASQHRATEARHQAEHERWSQFARQVETAHPVERVQKHDYSKRWARFTERAEAVQRAQKTAETTRERIWAQYDAQNRAAAAVRLARARARQQRWAKYGGASPADIRAEQEQQRKRKERWADFLPSTATGAQASGTAKPSLQPGATPGSTSSQ